MTVSDMVSDWIALRAVSLAPSTIDGYRRLLDLHIAPAIGDKKVHKLKPKHISAVLVGLCTAGHTRTAQLVRVLLRASLKDCVRSGQIDRNPADMVLPPSHVPSDRSYWSTADLKQFLAAADAAADPLRIAWYLALLLGLRRGELLGLRWSDVDLIDNTVTIANQRMRIDGQIIDRPPKSRAGRRVLPLSDLLLSLLRQHRRQQAAIGLAAGSGLPDYVITSPTGSPMNPETIRASHQRAIKRSGVPQITLHGMRHTMATLAVSQGVDIRVLQAILGHAHYSLTADTYAHVTDPTQRAAVNTISLAVR